jgi:hypothetical protein
MQRSMLSNEVKSIKEGALVQMRGLKSASLFNAVNKQVHMPLTLLLHASYTILTLFLHASYTLLTRLLFVAL